MLRVWVIFQHTPYIVRCHTVDGVLILQQLSLGEKEFTIQIPFVSVFFLQRNQNHQKISTVNPCLLELLEEANTILGIHLGTIGLKGNRKQKTWRKPHVPLLVFCPGGGSSSQIRPCEWSSKGKIAWHRKLNVLSTQKGSSHSVASSSEKVQIQYLSQCPTRNFTALLFSLLPCCPKRVYASGG